MTKEIIKRNEIPALSTGKFRVTSLGLLLESQPEWGEWEVFLAGLQRVYSSVNWVIGDALQFVETQYGEEGAQLLEVFPEHEYKTLLNCRYVCSAIEFSRRRENLSFGHHANVASLKSADQTKWLTKAGKAGWSVSEMRTAIRDHKRMNGKPIPEGQYNVLYADPPWQFANSGLSTSAENHYPTMATDEIASMRLPVAQVCFLWATNAMLEDAMFVMAQWGFEYKTNIVWIKPRSSGMGWYLKTRHELLLIGVKETGIHPITMPSSVVNLSSTKHSEKPLEFNELIESMYDGPYIELFARRQANDKWTTWGNETD